MTIPMIIMCLSVLFGEATIKAKKELRKKDTFVYGFLTVVLGLNGLYRAFQFWF